MIDIPTNNSPFFSWCLYYYTSLAYLNTFSLNEFTYSPHQAVTQKLLTS